MVEFFVDVTLLDGVKAVLLVIFLGGLLLLMSSKICWRKAMTRHYLCEKGGAKWNDLDKRHADDVCSKSDDGS